MRASRAAFRAASIFVNELADAEALLSLLPQQGWPAGVGTVLIPAARARLRLAQGRPTEALIDFQSCAAMFSAEVWGTEIRDVERPDIFSVTENALWDGRPSLGGVWVAHPDVTVERDTERYAARAVVTEGDDRQAAFDKMAAAMPRFAGYQEAVEREIPVIRLARADAA